MLLKLSSDLLLNRKLHVAHHICCVVRSSQISIGIEAMKNANGRYEAENIMSLWLFCDSDLSSISAANSMKIHV